MRSGERMLELVRAAPERGGRGTFTVEERSFGRTTQVDGWQLGGEPGGDAVLLETGDVITYGRRDGRLRVRARRTLREWVGSRLDRVVAQHGDVAEREDVFLDGGPSRQYQYGSEKLDRALRASLAWLEKDVMAAYAEILDRAGVEP